ncbi:VIT1/CCC1 transporter family protein [Rhodovulum sp. YNF3179]|uniref:VIT1/CCC1 transporter family protein n=1 Tax=Rhodovulum sp. YNF3179 TaxID=3425127 RepID=UPI003D335876
MDIDGSADRRAAHRLDRLQSYLRQIVYGGNDGIVTTFAIVAGFAGAGAEGAAEIGALAVLVFGLANLFADAVSMGLGEFLSARSERDLYMGERARELEEIRSQPEQEAREVFEQLRQRGLSREDAETTAEILVRNPEIMADWMMSYEMGMADPRDDTPAVNGLFTFVSFVLFGAVPLIPYFLMEPTGATFRLSVAATFLALVALGLLRWNATGERLRRCVGETVLVGGTCAVVAFAVGMIVGGGG